MVVVPKIASYEIPEVNVIAEFSPRKSSPTSTWISNRDRKALYRAVAYSPQSVYADRHQFFKNALIFWEISMHI